jgi:hypothetical protein
MQRLLLLLRTAARGSTNAPVAYRHIIDSTLKNITYFQP